MITQMMKQLFTEIEVNSGGYLDVPHHLAWLRCTTSVELLSRLYNVGFSILLVSTALMRPSRPKRFRL